jgi:hypothetical protein
MWNDLQVTLRSEKSTVLYGCAFNTQTVSEKVEKKRLRASASGKESWSQAEQSERKPGILLYALLYYLNMYMF